MRALIRAGLGMGILTPAEALAELQSGEFIFIPFLDKAIATSQLSLVTASHPSVTASRLAERIVAEMNAMVDLGTPPRKC